ncbi:MAG: hypothetical protein IPP90_15600 [Gemmatimonadaceae bacterium]|nr:hypothetical protein [Gemmatimonadaceae bacterium]
MNDTEQVLLPGWSHRIRMLTSGRLWKSFVLVFGIPVTVIAIIVAFTVQPSDGMLVLAGGLSLFAVLWALVGAIIDVSGGFTAAYVLTDRGVHFQLGKGSRGAADAATLLGAFARAPGAVGAGLLARSEQEAFIAWSAIRKVTVRARSRYVQIRAGLGSKPVGIYCTEQNFTTVCDLIRDRRVVAAG